jgi:hypothetical protein
MATASNRLLVMGRVFSSQPVTRAVDPSRSESLQVGPGGADDIVMTNSGPACSTCGAERTLGASWCGRCLTPFVERAEPVGSARGGLPRLPSSPTRSSPLSFGLRGRADGPPGGDPAYGWWDILRFWGSPRMLLDLLWVPAVSVAALLWLREVWARTKDPDQRCGATGTSSPISAGHGRRASPATCQLNTAVNPSIGQMSACG